MTNADAKPGRVKERILEAALQALQDSGLQGFSQVKVAKRAGVRQSHLTYYFPTRDALLEAVTAAGVDGLACAVRRAAEGDGGGTVKLLERLTTAVADPEHMRMFLAMIVEADGDATVRGIMSRATHRMEAVLADALGGENAEVRARLALAGAWGLGLYRFLMRPDAAEEPAREYVAWLARSCDGGAAGPAEEAGAR